MDKKIIYSGIQPTGSVTIGNYIGALQNWLKMQEDDALQCVYSIVDMHSLTVRQVPSELRARTFSFLAQYLACGLDPKKNIIYVQSHVPAHAQLTWILNCFTYIGEASRMSQFKEKCEKNADNINMGLMDYPVLMASDILLYNTNLVPIGIDQKQHLELARDLAIRFNNAYSPTFVVPEGYFPTVGAKIKGLQDPTKKMSKSAENENDAINLLDDIDLIRRKFRKAVTDSDGMIFASDDKPGVTNLLTIYSSFCQKSIEESQRDFEGSNYGAFKDAVADAVIAKLEPIQLEYKKLMEDKDFLMQVARDGAQRAGAIANNTLRKVYKKVGFIER